MLAQLFIGLLAVIGVLVGAFCLFCVWTVGFASHRDSERQGDDWWLDGSVHSEPRAMVPYLSYVLPVVVMFGVTSTLNKLAASTVMLGSAPIVEPVAACVAMSFWLTAVLVTGSAIQETFTRLWVDLLGSACCVVLGFVVLHVWVGFL